MDIRVEVGQPHERAIHVEIPWSEIEPDYNRKITEVRKKIKMPGFRPGKVPQKIFLQHYGGSILKEVMEQMIQRGYLKAIQEHNLELISEGQVEKVEQFDVGRDLKYTLSVAVEPEVTVFNYKSGFKLTRTTYEPTEKDFEHALEHLREQHAETTLREDGATAGDLIKGDLQYLDEAGIPIVGQRVEDRYIRVGEGVFGGKVADILQGAKAGDEVRFSIPGAEKSDPDRHILLNVKTVESYVLPEVNEEFAKLVNPQIESLAKLKDDIKADIQRQLDRDAKRAFQQNLIELVLRKTNLTVPEAMIENYLDRLVKAVKRDQPDKTVNEAEIRVNSRARAEREMKWYLVKKQIVANEGMKVEEADVEARLDTLVAPYGDQKEKIKAMYRKKETLRDIREEILENKIFEHLLSFGKIKNKTTTTDKLGDGHDH